MKKTVIKASGQEEVFNLQKLSNSLIRSGAPEDVAIDIARKVEMRLSPTSHTRYIYRLAKKMLRQYNHASGMRYSIKKAIASLGPSGYPFEKYFGKILIAYGYTVDLNVMINGYCVQHEVDVLASKGKEQYVIECKYHTGGGKPTDVRIALYIHSRFADIKKASEKNSGDRKVKEGWLVTNTRCTSDAIRYAHCTGLRIISWKYPEDKSLERMIENKRLYPVTILPSVKKQTLNILFSNNIVLAQEIADIDEETFIRESGLDTRLAHALKREADMLCFCLY